MIDEQSADRTRSEFARVAHGATVAPSQRQLDDGWRTMRSKLHDRGWFAASRSAAPVRRLLWAVPAAAALCGGVWGLTTLRSSNDVLTYAVSGSVVVRDGQVQTAGEKSGLVEFSDGTRVELAAHSAASVAELTASGANIRLQQGEASFDVKHRDDTRWTIDAGPFVVHVTGTAFKVRWDEARGHFQIEMRSGSVDVDGPTLSGQRPLRTGESIDVVLRPEAASLANEREQQPSEPPALDE
ncbi:MAG TPA: FecR family protein, partial [Polyangiaceae bacterium]|nr:FecR family protein [Polyangiaceae bacterium]